MKILFIVAFYYPHIGGVEYVVKSVAERLASQGHIVTVLAGEPKSSQILEEKLNGVNIIRWPTYAPGEAYHIPKKRSELRRLLLKVADEYDVIHVHSIHSVLSIYSLSVLKNHRIRKVLTPYYHGTGHTLFRRFLWKGWRRYVNKVLTFVDVVHTVSRLEAQFVERDFGVKALSIENGVDEWLLDVPWTPSDYLMYSGRIEKYKNIHRLANIVRILNVRFGIDLKLKIFGSGPFLKSLERYLKNLKISYCINPPQPFEKYIESLSKASIFGLLSEKESYPQSINEANAIGVPVIITEPWGINFSGRSRTLITQLDKSDEIIARELVEFLTECRSQPKSNIPSWNQVVNAYINNLYG